MQWYINLVGFGFHHHEEIDPQDDDVKVIPSLIEKAVIPKLIGKHLGILNAIVCL